MGICGRFKTEPFRGIVNQQVRLGRTQQGTFANERTDALLAERKWVIGAKNYALRAHFVDEKFQGALIENGRIHKKAIQVVTGRKLRCAACDRMMVPGIFKAAQQEREAPATVSKTDSQIGRQM